MLEEEIYCARLAQFSTHFVFSKKQNSGTSIKIVFSQFWPIVCSTIQRRQSTTQHNFFFFFDQNGGADKKMSFVSNVGPNFHFFKKLFAAQFNADIAQLSTTFFFFFF